ncbi:DoxX family protein [Paenibacillus sp. GD4]|uniref:DoxX family protein n=1 Tax=Paenibacillus sp. GD4 TaxID=3068890 RepID=UPI002796C522|nr:DoxX family protein [Paenibacillus sp. GD4]MDQ1913925.1 DoxX family protein [Paenibacillus sp. GD4]
MKKNVLYWICTVFMIALMGVGAIPNMMSSPESVAFFEHLGYPAYLLPFLGVAKLLGSIVILIPGFPRIKEWVYAGFVFDLTGALYSIISVGDINSGLFAFVLGYLAIAGSYILHHQRIQSRANAIQLTTAAYAGAK